MTREHIEFVLSEYSTDILADKLLELFDEEAASYQHTINKLNKALSENKGDFDGMTYGEVMKAVFGIKDEQVDEAKYLIIIYPKGNHHDPFIAIKREVWNSPYKGGE